MSYSWQPCRPARGRHRAGGTGTAAERSWRDRTGAWVRRPPCERGGPANPGSRWKRTRADRDVERSEILPVGCLSGIRRTREILAGPPGREAPGRIGRRVDLRRVPSDVGDHARAENVIAKLGYVHQHVLGGSGLHDLVELIGDDPRHYRIRELFAEIAAQVREVIVDAVLPLAGRGGQGSHMAVVVVGPDDDDVAGEVERSGVLLILRKHLGIHREGA